MPAVTSRVSCEEAIDDCKVDGTQVVDTHAIEVAPEAQQLDIEATNIVRDTQTKEKEVVASEQETDPSGIMKEDDTCGSVECRTLACVSKQLKKRNPYQRIRDLLKSNSLEEAEEELKRDRASAEAELEATKLDEAAKQAAVDEAKSAYDNWKIPIDEAIEAELSAAREYAASKEMYKVYMDSLRKELLDARIKVSMLELISVRQQSKKATAEARQAEKAGKRILADADMEIERALQAALRGHKRARKQTPDCSAEAAEAEFKSPSKEETSGSMDTSTPADGGDGPDGKLKDSVIEDKDHACKDAAMLDDTVKELEESLGQNDGVDSVGDMD